MNPLLSIARNAIQQGFTLFNPLTVRLESFPEELREERATFVTLKKGGQLRGCMGSVQAFRPLVEDVVHNAFAAAFQDLRFPPLREEELDKTQVVVSVLSPLERMNVGSEAELLEALRPGTDGLLLREGRSQATFLPAVWEAFGSPAIFVRALKNKAGLSPDHWSDTFEVYRYTVEEIP
jgi:AmmeMemoRadiSam system protein A